MTFDQAKEEVRAIADDCYWTVTCTNGGAKDRYGVYVAGYNWCYGNAFEDAIKTLKETMGIGVYPPPIALFREEYEKWQRVDLGKCHNLSSMIAYGTLTVGEGAIIIAIPYHRAGEFLEKITIYGEG